MKPIRIQLECPYNSSNKKIPMYEFFTFLYTLHKLSGFCHLGLVYSWFCDRALTLPSCLVFWWARGLECARAARSLVYMFHVGAWCSDPSTLVLFQAQFWFRVGVQTLTLQVWSCCGSVRSRVRSGNALLFPCAFVIFILLSLVLYGTQLVFFTGCVLSCLSCFVWTRGLWVSLLAACSSPVLHMACDSVLLTMCLCFGFVWAHGFCHSFGVPCALMSPILFPDYWLICPTCVISLPSSFAPFIISLCLQSCASSSSNVVCAWCPAQPCQSVFPYGVVFVCLFHFCI